MEKRNGEDVPERFAGGNGEGGVGVLTKHFLNKKERKERGKKTSKQTKQR